MTVRAKRPTRLAVFDYNVTTTSPAGSCVRAEVEGLCESFDVTVFAHHFDNPRPDRIRWVHIPCPYKPVVLRDWTFTLLSPLFLRFEMLRSGSFDLIQTTQGQLIGCDVSYAHFCHRAYMKNQWKLSEVTGLRRLGRWVGHSRNARRERSAFERAKMVVVPSKGLERELLDMYPTLAGKIARIPNPVDTGRFKRPSDFDRKGMRARMGFADNDVVVVFVALGDFTRKGLRILIDGIGRIEESRVKLLVVGGSRGEIEQHGEIARVAGVEERTRFAGLTKDVRPFLWAADIFGFPTAYETFGLAAVQAAAAGLPLMTTRVYGIEEFIEPGINGWIIERDAESVQQTLRAILREESLLKEMGNAAIASAARYDVSEFPSRWRECLSMLIARKHESACA